MELKKIESKEEYEECMKEIKKLTISGNDSNAIYLLSLIIQDYEGKSAVHISCDPVEMIQYYQQDVLEKNDTEMAKLLGVSKARFSEVKNRKRKLTLSLVQKCVALGMPPKVMLKRYGDSRDAIDRKIKKLEAEISRLANL